MARLEPLNVLRGLSVRIESDKLYIDTRLGYDPSQCKSELLGSEWIKRGTDQQWLVPVFVNKAGFLIQEKRNED